jgi:hypothetical protein
MKLTTGPIVFLGFTNFRISWNLMQAGMFTSTMILTPASTLQVRNKILDAFT